MILVMAVTLYTTRIVLKNLGVEDYGIYNIVAGVVSMFAFLNSSMAGATQRFLSFELGINDEERVHTVFCQSVIIHMLIALTILILSETIGLWFVFNKLSIPTNRVNASIWVYQVAILSFLINVMCVPYHAVIIAHEKMDIYAWASILDTFLKLGVAYMLSITPYDKLISYSLLLLLTTIIVFLFYNIYCKNHFIECRFRYAFAKNVFAKMFSFAGWNIIGNMAYIFRTQGLNILLNMFYGPIVNAAHGIASQVDGAAENFVVNFQTASNPQIIKSYALREYKDTNKLVCQCSKFSFYLMLAISIPIFFQIDYILSIWLTDIPPFTKQFVQLILLNGIIDSISKALITYAKATGNIKWYMIIQGGFYLLTLPVIYIFLQLGYSPIISFLIVVIFTFTGTFLRLAILHNIARSFSVKQYFTDVLCPTTIVGCISFALCFLLFYLNTTTAFGTLILNTILSIALVSLIIWAIGLTKSERTYIAYIVHTKIDKLRT